MPDTNALTVTPSGPLDDIQPRIKQFEQGQSAGIRALEGVTSETSKKIGGFEAAIQQMGSPPKLQTVPPPQPKMTDPLQIWGSMAMILAAVGSLKTRQPLTTAMNAAAAVMQGYKKGDVEAANSAYQAWKVANENAKAQFQGEMEAYKTILSGYERRESLAIQEGGMKERTIRAQLSAAASAFGDENSLLIAKEHSIEAFQRHLDHKQELLDKGFGTLNDIERKKIEADRTFELVQSPEYKDMSLEERAEKMAKIHGESSPAGQAKKQLQEIKKQDATYRLKEITRKIDDVINEYEGMSSIVDPTGYTGMVARPLEAARNRLPYELGGTDSTKYNDFKTKVQTIRSLVVPLVAGNTYRTNPTLRAQIDAIIPGLGGAESSQHMIQSLRDLKEMLPRLRGEFGVDEGTPRSVGPSKDLGSDPHRPLPLHGQEEYDAAPSGTWISGVDKNGKPVITQKP